MDRLASIKAFCTVVENRGFSSAAQDLNVSVAKISKLVQDLENHLSTKLLRRTTRSVTLTEAGELYYRSMLPLLAEIASVDDQIEQMSSRVSGTLKMTLPTDYGRRVIMPLLPAFTEQNPNLSVDLYFTDQRVDVVAEGFDLAIRIGQLKDSSLIAKSLGRAKFICAASPRYLAEHSAINHPSDLLDHTCLTYSLTSQPNIWTFENKNKLHRQKVISKLQMNNGDLLAKAAANHLGVIYQPDFILEPYFNDDSLVPLLQPGGFVGPNIYLVYPERQYLPMKVKAMMNFLTHSLNSEQVT